MCGIAGFLPEAGRPSDPSWIRSMCDRLVHRGPDGYGCYSDASVVLGHRRLSIIDLSGGAQPLGNEDGSLQVVFNGEIYNYRELGEDLRKRGHRFKTRSDTEVLLHLYEEVGERLPEYLNGMFAFALWDHNRHELFLARDRFGKKPLYYSFSVPAMRFCFASELKALTGLPDFDTAVDLEAVAEFLSLGYIPDPQTIYARVSKLRPAHSLTVGAAGARLRQYWRAEFPEAGPPAFDVAVEEIRAVAGDAVERRMISDVPLGGFLSGGVDSSAAVAFMARHASEPVKSFSIGFTDKKFDELHYARMAAGRYGTEHHEEVVSPSVEEMLNVLVEHYDEPFGDSSAIPMLYLARMTRRHVTVALCGDGADELFGGYRRYYFGVFEERLRSLVPGWLRRTAVNAAGRWYPKFDYLPQVFRAKALLTNVSLELGDAYFTSMSIFRDESLRDVLSPAARQKLGGYSPRENFRERFGRVSHLEPLHQMQAVDLETYLPGDILVKADRATMAYSLEGRSPWLDYRLAELAFRLPARYKVRGRQGKYIFKKAMEPYIPAPTTYRRKMGFSVPLAHWFRTSLRPVFQALVLDAAMQEYLDTADAARIWKEHQSGLHDHSRRLWNLLMLAAWDARHRRSRTIPGSRETGHVLSSR